MAKRTKRAKGTVRQPRRIYELEITLVGTDPPVWRRIAVPANIHLSDLHDVIQNVMPWWDCHLHEFRTFDGDRFGYVEGNRAREAEMGMEWESDRLMTLDRLLLWPNEVLLYVYDFGDDWKHTIRLVRETRPERGVRYPTCLAGRLACPPEDCGGVLGYCDLVRILANPQHKEHREMRAWADWITGGPAPYDPQHFSVEETNLRLAGVDNRKPFG